MNPKSQQSQGLFDDYLFGQPRRSKSPLRNNGNTNNNPISFAQLSRPNSRPGSMKKGLFRMQIEKSKLKEESNQLDNPYHLLTGSAQPYVSKSPSKLITLKTHGSLNRPKSPIKPQQHCIIFPRNQDTQKALSKDEKFRISFSSLTKKENLTSGGSTTSNQSLKQNTRSIINKIVNNKQSIKQPVDSIYKIQKQIHMVSEVKGSLKKQPSKCQTNTSINSLEQEDQVNISVSGSMADINLDMNPYLF